MDELLLGHIRMTIPARHFGVSTDSMALADFCRIARGSRVLDLGCGCGLVSLLLLGSDPSLTACGVELLPDAARQARENAAQNGLSAQFTVVCGDLREEHTAIAPGSFDCAVSNPPYYPPRSGFVCADASLAAARSELHCSPDELCRAAARALRWGGRFFLVHKPERLADLICALRGAQLEPKRMQLVQHRASALPSLVLLEARRGGKPGLACEPNLILYDETGLPTAAYRRIYHLQE